MDDLTAHQIKILECLFEGRKLDTLDRGMYVDPSDGRKKPVGPTLADQRALAELGLINENPYGNWYITTRGCEVYQTLLAD